MKKNILSFAKRFLAISLLLTASAPLLAQRTERTLQDGWQFHLGEAPDGAATHEPAGKWIPVSVPHDWAIAQDFNKKYDMQTVAITQNGEHKATEKTGRTGGLPYMGIGWYRLHFSADPSKETSLLFDGAMSHASVYVNGKKACFWPYGYNAFHCNITPYLNKDGKNNLLAVRLENEPESSRWYPGAGLFRNVHLIQTNRIHIPIWGVYLTTPYVSKEYASVKLLTQIKNLGKSVPTVITTIYDEQGNIVATRKNQKVLAFGQPNEEHLNIYHPHLWSPETPYLYKAVTKIYVNNQLQDSRSTTFGIRKIEFIADKGFFLNGKPEKFKGVCNHHDLGPLGAAVNKSALIYRIQLLKEMGCNAIRTSHNMPSPELVQLCDSMGMMMMVEAFDEWDIAKCKNGYHKYFDEWAEKDMTNMLRHYRNDPSVILWSIGNEINEQRDVKNGYNRAKFLVDICHREDPTRLVSCGMNYVNAVINNGFATALDLPGFNYHTYLYKKGYEKLPHNLLLGSETASTISARGVYHFPVKNMSNGIFKDHQCSSYDVEYCPWSNIPDYDFYAEDKYPWLVGQFVWTGFDYLGEPTPYDTNGWPNHSSMFGIIDLASLPKDRFYLYRSVWNPSRKTLHILPHWTWPERVGKITPVYVYTNYPSAELFLNGKSLGIQKKSDKSVMNRYRLMWNNVVYEPGTLTVIAYDKNGNKAAEASMKTAGKPFQLHLQKASIDSFTAQKGNLCYITVSAIDKAGNLCPRDMREVHFKVKGNAVFKATANGDATSLDNFQKPMMRLFNGKCTLIIESNGKPGTAYIEAKGKGIKTGKLELTISPK